MRGEVRRPRDIERLARHSFLPKKAMSAPAYLKVTKTFRLGRAAAGNYTGMVVASPDAFFFVFHLGHHVAPEAGEPADSLWAACGRRAGRLC
jgi:hypothetical protein